MYAGRNGPAGLVLGFGGFGDKAIEEAARKLAAILKKVAK
jgi:GntR family transcriptional regulator/MocR family aminotransferase